MNSIKYIAFDADDTLWVNEPLFQKAEMNYRELLSDYLTSEKVSEELYSTEKQNISLYGYGVKSFTLSMIETALRISDYKLPQVIISEIIELGKAILTEPVVLLDGVKDILKELYTNYKLVVATKGDLLDQERKLNVSGLNDYFHHVEVMSDKQEQNYQKLLNHLEINNDEFLMVGNSLKSDIIPVVNLGASAIHIPYHTTWQHEIIEEKELNDIKYHKVNSIAEITEIINMFDKKD